MANDHSKLPKRVMANDRSQLLKHNYYENSRLSAGLGLYLTLGHKVNDNSSIIFELLCSFILEFPSSIKWS